MQVAFALSLLYIACFAFYHADSRRTAVALLKRQTHLKAWVQAAAWAACLAALLVVADLAGWERGVPIWIGLFTLAGVASLFVVSINTKRHLASAVISLLVLVVSGMVLSVQALI